MEIPKVEFRLQGKASIGIEIIELDALYKRLPSFNHDPSIPHRVNFYNWIYITKGAGSHFIDFNHYPFQAGSFIFVNKHQIHAFDFKSRPEGQVILFTDEFVDAIHTNIRMPFFAPTHLVPFYWPVFKLSQALKDSCETLLLEINKEQGHSSRNKLLIELLFSSLILMLIREMPSTYAKHLSKAQAKDFIEFISLIHEKHTSTRDASVYAQMMHMTYKSLNQICKLAANQTPKQLIDAHTILEAKRSIVIEETKVQQLAYALGFKEVTNFVKYFKKHTLVTPSQFKKKHKG